MPSPLKFCGCRTCRRGLRTKTGGTYVQSIVRKARRAAKRALRRGEEPAPAVSVGYTD